MSLASRLGKLEKASTSRGRWPCPQCGSAKQERFTVSMSTSSERRSPSPGCPRCGSGAVYVIEFADLKNAAEDPAEG